MNGFMNFLNDHLTPFAAKVGSNRYLKAISSGFIAVMSATIVGSMFTLLTNLPIKAWTDWLAASGVGSILAIPSQVTVDLIAIYAVFFIAYSLAREFQVDGAGAGLTALVSFLLLTGRTPYFATAAADAKTVNAIALDYLGAKGLFTAIIVGLLGGRIYVAIVKKGWVIKLPDSVPPNVANSFSALIPLGITVAFWLVIAGLMKQTSYGTLSAAIFTIIQSNLMRFMGNSYGSWLFFNLMTNLLWFFGLHGGNIVGSITNPIYVPLALENLATYEADPTAKMPYIISGSFAKTFTFGGVGSMMGMAILMCLFAKSKQYKVLGRLALPTTIFFINEPLLFGMPVVLNPMFFLPLMLVTPICGTLTYFMMKAGVVPIPHGVQLPWTTPGIINGFLQGGPKLAIWEALMILLSMVLWYPFFKMGDAQALKEEQASEGKEDAE